MADVDKLEKALQQKQQELAELQQEVQRLKQEKTSSVDGSEDVDRRTFLKTVAAGTAGISLIGAASGFSIQSPTDFSFIGDGSQDFNVDTDGNMSANSLTVATDISANTVDVTELSGSLTNDRSITNIAGNIYVQSSAPSNPQSGDLWIDTSQ